MTRGEFIRKWLGNPNRPYTAEMRDEMWDDLEKVTLRINLASKKHFGYKFGQYLIEEASEFKNM
jgi:hypothetical protein